MKAMVVIIILYGQELEAREIAVRRWSWENI